MPQPLIYNTTCDIYRNANAPPAAPDVAGVRCRLEPIQAYDANTNSYWTHTLFVETSVDIRDDYPTFADGRTGDKVYVPDQNGTLYRVVLVRRQLRATDQDHKRVILRRQTVTWPSNDV